MSNAFKNPEEWKSCESGFLVGLSKRAKSARRRRIALRLSSSIAVLICAIGLGLWSSGWWPTPRENYFGGIACHEVQENMPAMMAGTLSDDLRARIEAHLQQCPVCREMMQKMQVGQASTSAPHDFWTCDCAGCQRDLAQAISRALNSTGPDRTLVAASFPRPANTNR